MPADAVYEALVTAGPGPHRVTIPQGVVTIEEMAVAIDPETGETVVEVYAPHYTDPHIRVINPPRYRPDPAGTIELGLRRWADDPLGALAHLIFQHGGTRVPLGGNA